MDQSRTMNLKHYEQLGWKYEYCSAIPAYLLINPSGKLVWKDDSFAAQESHVVKMIEMFGGKN